MNDNALMAIVVVAILFVFATLAITEQNVAIEAVKAGLEQDHYGRWVQP
jgi:hypothetical protein